MKIDLVLCAGLAAGLAAPAAWAQTYSLSPNGPAIPNTGILCVSPSGVAVACAFNPAAGTIGSGLPSAGDLAAFSQGGTLTSVSPSSGLPIQGTVSLANGASITLSSGAAIGIASLPAPPTSITGTGASLVAANIAQPLPAITMTNGANVQNQSTNDTICLGGGAVAYTPALPHCPNGYQLVPGQSVPVAVAGLAALYWVGPSSSDNVGIIGN